MSGEGDTQVELMAARRCSARKSATQSSSSSRWRDLSAPRVEDADEASSSGSGGGAAECVSTSSSSSLTATAPKEGALIGSRFNLAAALCRFEGRDFRTGAHVSAPPAVPPSTAACPTPVGSPLPASSALEEGPLVEGSPAAGAAGGGVVPDTLLEKTSRRSRTRLEGSRSCRDTCITPSRSKNLGFSRTTATRPRSASSFGVGTTLQNMPSYFRSEGTFVANRTRWPNRGMLGRVGSDAGVGGKGPEDVRTAVSAPSAAECPTPMGSPRWCHDCWGGCTGGLVEAARTTSA